MHISICMSSINHDKRTRSEAMQHALDLREQYSFTGVEIVLEGIGRRYAPYPWEWEETDIKEMEDFLSHFEHTGAHLPFWAMNVIAVNERVREDAMDQMFQSIEMAKRFKLDYAVVHGTGTTEGMLVDREPARMQKALTRMAELCQDSTVTLSIENAMNLHDIGDCVDMIGLIKGKGLDVGMTFDTGHSNLPRPGSPKPYEKYGTTADAIENCFELLNNIHLHNNHGESDQHLGLNDGTLDLKSCVIRLKELGYQGSLSLEVGAHVPSLANEIETVLDWLK